MSFLRHQRSFRPMGKEQTGSRLGAHSRLSSARMSRSRLFLGGSVSTGARFRFTGCGQNAVQYSCRSSNLQRTANSVLFGCLSQGVHPKLILFVRLHLKEVISTAKSCKLDLTLPSTSGLQIGVTQWLVHQFRRLCENRVPVAPSCWNGAPKMELYPSFAWVCYPPIWMKLIWSR